MSAFDVPCRVSADLRAYLAEQDMEPEEFNEYEESHVREVVDGPLVKPVMNLLSLRNQILAAERLGGLNESLALKWVREELDSLYQACRERYRDYL